jgi:hypothetical protein
MRPVFRSLFDPSPQRGPLGLAQILIGLRWRHALAVAIGEYAADQFARAGLARNDGARARARELQRFLGAVQAQASLSRRIVWAVTLKAVVGEDWTNVSLEINWNSIRA